MKILLSGFEPFEGESVNSSFRAITRLNATIAGAAIITVELPTTFGQAFQRMRDEIEREEPDIIIGVGQGNGRYEIGIEKFAINWIDARIPDNAGQQPIDEQIFPDGDSAYFSNLPVKAMVEAIRAQRLPAAVSYSAGTFVCNYVMYGILYFINKQYPAMRGGFIHVPYIPEQVLDKRNTPSMSLPDIVSGLTCAIAAAVEYSEDVRTVGGSIA